MATHASVSGLLDAFVLVRERATEARGTAAGRLSDDQVDLLRAALVFTSSGLDATCHTIVREAVPSLIRKGGQAHHKFGLFIEDAMRNPTPALVAATKSRNPRTKLIALYIDAKTKASYQGTNDLKDRVRDVLGIPNAVLPKAQIDSLQNFFTARNDIVHQLDYVDPAAASNRRNHRAPRTVVRECDAVLSLLCDLIDATAQLG